MKRIIIALGLMTTAAQAQDADLIARGEYLARAGDCVACHTVEGGAKFAGGYSIISNMGTIWSTNITPDKEHGIGNYSLEDFTKAVRQGVTPDGTHLYPAMPYPSYAKVTDEDMAAMYAYFMQGVEPVATDAPETALGFPFNMRFGMMFWNLAFRPSDVFTPNPDLTEEQNRGAYLVEGLGHCGACHTPRGIGMQEKGLDAGSDTFLAGSELNGWPVPGLRAGGEGLHGVQAWTEQDIADYLGMGRNRFAATGGEMKAVIQHSMNYMTDDDLHAIAAYLKTMPGEAAPSKPLDDTARVLTEATDLTEGQRLYLDNCNACHFVDGTGGPKVFPQLDGASVVTGDSPDGLIHTILAGAATPSTERAPSIMPMPGFADRLSDDQVAEIATFVRGAWTNDAAPVSAADVATVRKAAQAEAHAKAPEAAAAQH
ncbi:cytochrome c [Falsirhodobacter sp. 20TX0035]|uniref:cytochrome c n=1 Tax=Falsirhodobacter sp. 20TX0035 TaxID=3022019 RepID=UPI00232C0DF1|nr:cytochrome c [Falsirhodobacter sp. 20TX0035]MDB6455097.1 cytochrome c [Falsirhodobacter sp. 20TX0035]